MTLNMKIISKLINRYKKSEIKTDTFIVLETKKQIDIEDWDWAVKHGSFHKTPYTGKGQRVAVLDTGVDITHRDLKGIVTPKCFIKNCQDYPDYFDANGHGTFVVGEIVAQRNGTGLIGIAPSASCLCAKVLYGSEKDNTLSINDIEMAISNAIKYAITDGCGVISMSLGIPFKSQIIEEAINLAVQNGVICCAAAGNEGMDGKPVKLYPAAFENVISVAGTNQYDLPSWFSTQGEGDNKLEQPEVAISSLEYYWGCYPINRYTKLQGTSMACPMLAGVALLWREAMVSNNLLPKGENVLGSFREWLKLNSEDSNKNGWDSHIGFGVLKLQNSSII